MSWQFIKYFFRYIFFSKTRQGPLMLAMAGLFVSAFSLMVLQSIMGGLQKNLIKRSKDVVGTTFISLKNPTREESQKVLTQALDMGLRAYREFELELLLKHDNYLSPVVVHGLDNKGLRPSFLKESNPKETILGEDLAYQIQADYLSKIQFISPSHVNEFLGDVPRSVSAELDNVINTGVPDVDMHHAWVRASLLHNLVRDYKFNRIRFVDPVSKIQAQSFEKYGNVLSWEQQNKTLVWALNLENKVMMILFSGMGLLSALCILSGFLIFFNKIKIDLMSFWILGSPLKRIDSMLMVFIQCVGILSTLMGTLMAVLFLILWRQYAPDMMPDIFIERKLPVHMTLGGFLLSLGIPYALGLVFSYMGLRSFQKAHGSFTQTLRAVT